MVTATGRRAKVPFWAVPVLAGLPVWAYVYVGTLDAPESASSGTVGADVYAAACAACHGSEGQGGTGPGFGGGAVFETWPSFDDHIEWVQLGGTLWAERHGPTYGDTDKPVNGAAMPGFDDQLTDRELVHVVLHERTVLAGTNPDPTDDERLRAVATAINDDPSLTLDAAIQSAADPTPSGP